MTARRLLICRLDHLRPAERSLRVGLNRYPNEPPIGVYAVWRGHGIGFRWLYLGTHRPPTKRAIRRAQRQLLWGRRDDRQYRSLSGERDNA
jgi:hypothetical protein